MASVVVQRVEKPSENQLDDCAALFASLMKDDLAILSLSGGDVTLMNSLARSMICACALGGEYYIATNGNEELLGFAVWMPPGQQIFSTEEQRQLGLNDFMARLPDVGKEYYKTTYFTEFPKFVANSLGSPTWKADFWWLHAMMVCSEYQGQGVARALVGVVRDKAMQTGSPIALSTTSEKNVLIYSKLGFQLNGNRMMPSPWGEWPLFVFSLHSQAQSS